jgi:tetratricopeptide (TPR) repeat protein
MELVLKSLSLILGRLPLFIILFSSGCGKSSDPLPKKEAPVSLQETSSESKDIKSAKNLQPSDSQFPSFYDLELEELQSLVSDFFKNKDWKNARQAMLVLLEDDPESPDHHFKFARVCFELGDFPAAMEEFRYLQSNTPDLEKLRLEQIQNYLDQGQKQALILRGQIQEETHLPTLSEMIFQILKIDPEMRFKIRDNVKGVGWHSRNFYIVSALNYYKESLRERKDFWTYYKLGFLHFQMRWYEDTLEDLEKALTLADTQEQVIMALRLQSQARRLAPKGEVNALDKLAALDLTEDMLEEFLGQYAKDLSQAQIHKIRRVMKTGMRLKERLDRVETDEEKLEILQEFQTLSKEMLEGESFPPEIQVKVEKGYSRAIKLFARFREQIRIKQEALAEVRVLD